ncbi:sensor histidine kinase [Thermoactinospora rubra]|uniref:sensor histidine kinase n=1 Tax=Thermoactinospora rubra TaxID=1088767 RepID=UPI000A102718|nr:HAMP domain-containing sensor histidine kinase [Thermoactinospora rubra]
MRAIPLRIKLTALTLALLAVGLTFMGVVSVSVMHTYLIQRVDEQIDLISQRAHRKLSNGRPFDDKLPNVEFDAIVLLGRPGQPYRSMVEMSRDVDSLPRPVLPQPADGEKRTVPAAGGQGEWRVKATTVDQGVLVIAVDLREVADINRHLVLIELLGCGGILLILAVVGVATVRRSLRPLDEIERTTSAIAAGDLSRRVPEGDPRTEIGRLARGLNSMLAQIEAAFRARSESEAAARRSEDRMRRFVADASHELRTPLTSIRGFAEYSRQNPEADLAAMMQRIEEAASRMGLLVDDLLLLARVDQHRPLRMRPVDMLALAADAVHDARILAPDRDITLDVAGGGALIVSGDEVRLRQVVGNLMSNALAHTPEGTPVTVRVGLSGERVFLEVADKGPGLTAEQIERVFERFYRADSARSRRSGEDRGSGLGLAIVDALVDAHGGTVSVQSEPGAGATFRVELPLALE